MIRCIFDLQETSSALYVEFRPTARSMQKWVSGSGKTVSAADLASYMSTHPGAQRKAFDAVLEASRTIDAKYGTQITQSFWKNIIKENYTSYP
jgi:hypothetical protein